MPSFNPNKRKRGGSAKKYTRKRQKSSGAAWSGTLLSKAQVKRLIRTEKETKVADCVVFGVASEHVATTPLTIGRYNEGNQLSDSTAQPFLHLGGGEGQRIGNEVFVNSLQLRLQVHSTPNYETVASRPSVVRLMIVMFDTSPSNTNASTFLETENFPNLAPSLAQYRTDASVKYRVLYDRVFSPDRGNGLAFDSGVSAYPTGGTSYFIKKTIRINKSVIYDHGTEQRPSRNPIYVYLINDDDNIIVQNPVWGVRGTMRYKYTDA